MTNVERYNYGAQFGTDLDAVVEDIRRILTRGDYDRSKEAQAFERAFASYLEIEHARTVACGTDALILTMRALGLGPGDEVITQANTFYATFAAIAIVGAIPVPVDVDEETFEMDLAQLDAAVTPRTRAIVPVHMFGKPNRMAEIMDFAGRHGLLVVEDAAQAHGARTGGKRVGTFGNAGCFSFHPSKNLAGAGNGGCVVTPSQSLATAIEAHRTHGQLVTHEHVCLGVNSKLDALQAVVLLSKLPKLDEWNARRRDVARRYRERLGDLEVSFQREDPDEEHVYHLFQMRTSRRDALLDHLRRSGIDAVVRYPIPVHLQPPFECYGWVAGQFPRAERLAQELVCLPIRPDLTEAEQESVVRSVREFYTAAAA
ncbi:MAG TPA: DegT/DnrJ/EryC1/StrS family aminotransferase [Candidatus Baltobacteraceae bacterium]|nr:DegT/DnrJ/EryC1/StrS family aminotransferase [Candidatus Baltobacteraceae bacterium]